MAWLLAFGTLFATVLLTSLGNMAVAIGLSLGGDRRPVVIAYAASLLLVVVLALGLGLGADRMLPAEGWLGWPVLGYGIWDAWKVARSRREDAPAVHVSFVSTLVVFILLSIDTLAVLVPLFAEEADRLRLPAVLGSVAAIAVTAGSLELLTEKLAPRLQGRRWTDVAGPLAMILAGLYILLDTPTDAV
ncbi:hypothetical protein [Marinibacterium profundimaris]|uniref:Uncharacterized protein n=1 Tax=Marinibacterium profundimaris TaxID=1679460 RepID=A0A225NRH6_9RHOB|nr:hypothetical protein [Marinibacterium profundimaris]OWU77463.1 hypothetical protein ATO3_01795 [Marinibacterium profundimaris]